jgi:MinD-like ATPase involved in chromosome partitioning or flagellar assembly
MSTPGMVITFYAYKGGTGRTMALANTAVLLARERQGRVLMVDWDLEAPGLHEFFPELSKSVGRGASRQQPGLVELFEKAAKSLQGNEQSPSPPWQEMNLEQHIIETAEPSLDLMPAGNFGDNYGERVANLPWQGLFQASPALFRSFADELATRYKYVLVDSRTGVTDSSGICTTLLPDHLVLVFTPNRQSLSGALETAQKAITYRGQSTDLRPLLTYPLASRVEASEDDLRRAWRFGDDNTVGYQPTFETTFKQAYDLPECELTEYFDEIQVQQVPRYAYGEQIAVRDETADRLSLARSFEQFTGVLTSGDGPWAFRRSRRDLGDESATISSIDHVKVSIKRHRKQADAAQAQNRLMNALQLGFGGVATIIVIAIWLSRLADPEESIHFTDELLPVILVGGLLVAGVQFVRRLLAVDLRRVAHTRAANALERELNLFEAHGGPYAGTSNFAPVLAERHAAIEAGAEDALLGHDSPLTTKRAPNH